LQLEVLLNQEKAARHDLEMHIEVLKDQNKFFVEEIDKLKDELTTGKKELEVERDNLKEMKLVLEQTNIRFLKTQDELSREIHSMKNKRNTGDVQSIEQDDDIESGSLQLHSLSQTRSNSAGMGTGPVLGVPPRRRAASWSEGRKLINDENELNVWKSMVEQLQRLLSEQHYELQNMKGTLSSYENQLERTQGQLMQEIDGKDTEIFKMREEVKKIQAALLRERKTREDLQRALVQNKEDMKIKVEGFQANERRLKQKHKTFKDKFTETKHDIQKQLATFTEERSRLQGIADQNQEEYQCLKDLQANEKMVYESKIKKLSQEKVDAEVNLALTMEELTKLRDAFAERESILTTEIEELKRLLSVSHHESSSFQEQLTASISETEEIKKINSQLERERFDAILSRSNLQEKSKDFIETQQREITQLRREKDEYKQLNDHLKVQLSQLKSQLDDNEQAQKEFMELSQSLQVRLIEMEDEAERNSLNRSMDGSSLNRSMDGSSTEGTSQH
jgi:chromosome segregation ATPase